MKRKIYIVFVLSVFLLLSGCVSQKTYDTAVGESYHRGYNVGYEDGEYDSTYTGYNIGYEDGYQAGYDIGHSEGYTEARNTKDPVYVTRTSAKYHRVDCFDLKGCAKISTPKSTAIAAGYLACSRCEP